ncbi:MAG: capsular biosynthesis protein [Zymomonas mobilis subsp. pomaceae]|uniref:Capsule polysaccharide biosynthesis protein n=1 Tax=Zymomonas mobilis subsp. pomaceae (strain ATCC 29192 / DSM 22645 / JCM 10191 / CCUG 17912 / NBRC 13757 / NCIMB 11200 / NRRL B-4491 / Barker I) TaxID=579138 RepID=F8ETZ6_ZYMMT|nr:capsular biosynthesis protein [Zymomonas mobilis]AEI38093.1 Capsule polysaccharide biosynthesis protein [Zymomonas mobilis subsp. pomaceae ATCC 29192]MDX5949459.1 capsular biosynthesis protein [Zymomonas mobilis subsp. pomaceae]GEB89202.1 capsular polysaccharide biosynthesis protein [Zymomonas mobilis subsp. pomaceae]
MYEYRKTILSDDNAPLVAAPGATPVPLPNRNLLLLQGLMGPLFRRLGQALMKQGYTVYKVNFNGGDRFFWRLPNGIDYCGDESGWPDFFEALINRFNITDVILFGDCRALHRGAIRVCHKLHIPVHVFEEGYIRPDWVTLELGGVNGHSSLPKDPEWYKTEAAKLPVLPEHKPVPSSFVRRAYEGISYSLATAALKWHYPYWKDYRPWPPLVEGVGWLRRLCRRKKAQARTDLLLARLEREQTPYVLFPLQLDADSQVRLHSPFNGMLEAIELVLGSFAHYAPKNLRLVIKEHPLDNGVRDWCSESFAIAKRLGIADRIDYMERGDIALVTQKAQALVTINSTCGTLALNCNVPVITLGQAVYDIIGVTYQGELDNFWENPGKPDQEIFSAFKRVLIERCLVPGGFFSEEALAKVMKGVLTRLQAACPIEPSLVRSISRSSSSSLVSSPPRLVASAGHAPNLSLPPQ